MKKLWKILVVFGLVFSLLSCASNNENSVLAVGKYVLNENSLDEAWLIIKEGNVFEFNRGGALSYRPSGDYTIKKDQLILTANKDEVYKFEIVNDTLKFLGNKDLEETLETGSLFKLIKEDKNFLINNVENIEMINLYRISGTNREVKELLLVVKDEEQLEKLLTILNAFTLQNGIVSMMAPMYQLEIVYIDKDVISYDLWLKANEQATIGSLEDSHKIYGLNSEMSKQLMQLLNLN